MFVVVAFCCTFGAGFLCGGIWVYARHVLPALTAVDVWFEENRRLRQQVSTGSGTTP